MDPESSVKLVVGLGNPGERYAQTPHNAGFMVVDELAARLSCRLRASSRCRAQLGSAETGGQGLILAKPQTYMNASGEAVVAILQYRKIPAEDLLVVVDDADLELGRVRVRLRGSSGGHRGLESIIGALGTGDFARVRVGIGRDSDRELVDQVLRPLKPGEREPLVRATRMAADAVLCVLERGVAEAMNRFNGVKAVNEQASETTSEKKVEKPN